MTTPWAIQQALYATLTGDAPLMALVGGVYDHVPQGADFAYLIIGDDITNDFDDDLNTGLDAELTIHAWGRAHRGRKEVKVIQARVYTLLHRNLFAVAGANTIESFVEFQDSFLDADGITHHGVQKVRLVVTTA